MLIALCVFCLALTVVGFIVSDRTLDSANDVLSIIVLFATVVVTVSSIILIGTTAYTAITKGVTVDMRHVQLENTRNALISLYEKYERLTDTDVTSSTSYYQVYSDIITFNNRVIAAQTYNNQPFWAYVLYDPAYEGLRLISLE